jgi:hypothetical protein
MATTSFMVRLSFLSNPSNSVGAPGAIPTLASFYANGTKRLQSQPKNDCGKLPSLDSLPARRARIFNISPKSDFIASGILPIRPHQASRE